jgi:hypothetical protein
MSIFFLILRKSQVATFLKIFKQKARQKFAGLKLCFYEDYLTTNFLEMMVPSAFILRI